MTARQPFGESFSAGQTKFPAALFTTTSNAPQAPWSEAAIFATSSSYRTSHVSARASAAPAARSRSTVSASGPSRRPQTATRAPSRAKRSAAARPSPLPPPVTRTLRADATSEARFAEDLPFRHRLRGAMKDLPGRLVDDPVREPLDPQRLLNLAVRVEEHGPAIGPRHPGALLEHVARHDERRLHAPLLERPRHLDDRRDGS